MNATSSPSHGKYLFWNAAEDKLFAIVQADTSANLLSSYAEVTLDPATIPPCTFSVSPHSIYVSSDTSNFFVNVSTTCAWNITLPDSSWIYANSWLTETGSQQATFNASPNVNYASPKTPTSARSETITVAGQPVTITQASSSCVYSLSAHEADIDSTGGTFTVKLTTGANCGWTAQSTQPWITINGSSSGTGNATIQYSVSANPGTQNRFGTLNVAGLSAQISQQPVPPMPPVALDFVPVTPCRLVDTRQANGPLGGPFIPGRRTRDFPIPTSNCGIPSDAGAYSLNVTVVPHRGLGYLTVWPTGQLQPFVSTLNSLDGRTKANAAIIRSGIGGSVSVYVTDDADVVIDTNGYFVPSPAANALEFFPLAPCRVADTRKPDDALAGPILGGGSERDFPILQSSCQVPSSAQAYSLNFTAVPNSPLGYLTVWPSGGSKPFVSTLNALTGAITANAAIVPAGKDGQFSTFVTGDTHLVVDVNGYFGAAGTGGLHFYAIQPCRVLDTRNGAGEALNGTLAIQVARSSCVVPASAEAYVVNATVVPNTSLGYLSLWPDGATKPLVSTLNAIDGAITSNMAIVPASSGAIDAFTNGPSHLVLDITGYFAP